MKVCVIGAGAIGGFIGIRLARIGCDVAVLARGATAAALQAEGWRLDSGGETIQATVRTVTDTAGLGPQDLVVLAVKGPALATVAAQVPALLGPGTLVLTAMNGVPWWFFQGLGGVLDGARLTTLDGDGVLAAAIPAQQVIGCVVHAGCTTPAPGLVRHVAGNGLIIGEPTGGSTPRASALRDLLARAGFDVTLSDRIQGDIWYKLWGNMTMNPASALTGATMDKILDDPLINSFCLRVMAEAAAIGAAIGCPISQSGEERNAITRKLGAFRTSMLQDVEAGKPLEIDGLLTAVREIADRLGQATPNLDALLGLTRLMARERGLYP